MASLAGGVRPQGAALVASARPSPCCTPLVRSLRRKCRRATAGSGSARRILDQACCWLIGSSDNHKARAGSGYKEFARKAMGDAWGGRQDFSTDWIPGSRPRRCRHRWRSCPKRWVCCRSGAHPSTPREGWSRSTPRGGTARRSSRVSRAARSTEPRVIGSCSGSIFETERGVSCRWAGRRASARFPASRSARWAPASSSPDVRATRWRAWLPNGYSVSVSASVTTPEIGGDSSRASRWCESVLRLARMSPSTG